MEWGCSSLFLVLIWLLLVWSIPEAIYFTYELHARIIGVVIETCYCFHRSDFHRSDLLSRYFTSLMNIACLVLSFIWAPMQLWLLDHLATSLDSSAISGLLHYQGELFSNRGSMEKLWYWRFKSRSNCVQSAILLPLHSQLCQWDDECELFPYAHPPDAKRRC